MRACVCVECGVCDVECGVLWCVCVRLEHGVWCMWYVCVECGAVSVRVYVCVCGGGGGAVWCSVVCVVYVVVWCSAVCVCVRARARVRACVRAFKPALHQLWCRV